MKLRSAFLILGVAIGMAAAVSFEKKSSQPARVIPVIPEGQVSESEDLSARIDDSEAIPVYREPETGAAQAPVRIAAKVLKPARLNLNEEMVKLLEEEKDSLREQNVYAKQIDGGWKLEALHDNHVLRRAGLQPGSVITFDNLKKELADPSRRELASRFTDVLRYIER